LVVANCPIPVEFKCMKTGDYQIDDVLIERKKIGDFANSIISKKKRMWKQAERLKKFKHPYILISGKLSEVQNDVTEHAMLGAMAALACPKFDKDGVMIEPPITVLWVGSSKQLAYLILKIFEKHGKLRLPPTHELQKI
jgi:ERCC4-type nuclease